jgi:S1-C subfamily serine protease
MDRRSFLFASLAAVFALAAVANAQAGSPRAKLLLPPSHDYIPKLGIYGQAVPNYGMLVRGVVRGSEAHRIGLEPGDVILSINNHRIHCEHDYFNALRNSSGVLYLRVLDSRGRGVVGVRAYLPYDPDRFHILER